MSSTQASTSSGVPGAAAAMGWRVAPDQSGVEPPHSKNMSPNELWRFLPFGYLLTILVETPILLVGLSRRHPFKRKLFAGVWLTACTYPIVVLVLPLLFGPDQRISYLLVAETFAPVAECVLFWLAFGNQEAVWTSSLWRDLIAIIVANLASFGIGEVMNAWKWFGLM